MFIYSLGRDRAIAAFTQRAAKLEAQVSAASAFRQAFTTEMPATSRGSSASRRSTPRPCGSAEIGWLRVHHRGAAGWHLPGRARQSREACPQSSRCVQTGGLRGGNPGDRRNLEASSPIYPGFGTSTLSIRRGRPWAHHRTRSPTRPRGAPMHVNGLRKTFRVKDQPSTRSPGLDLTVRPGRSSGCLGPNGAGKTTTLRILTTLMPADDGEASSPGPTSAASRSRSATRIGYVGPARRSRRQCHRPGEPAARRAAVRAGRSRGAAARNRAARHLRPVRAGQPGSPHVLRWPAAPPGGRARHHAPAVGPVPRRANDLAWTRRTAPTCGTSCGSCATAADDRSSPRTTLTRPTSSATGSRSSTTARSSPWGPRMS